MLSPVLEKPDTRFDYIESEDDSEEPSTPAKSNTVAKGKAVVAGFKGTKKVCSVA